MENLSRMRIRRLNHRQHDTIITLTLLLLLSICVVGLHGLPRLNHPSLQEFPVRGVDVSSYQGEIDWKRLSMQGISFAFVKATEGSSYVDSYFAGNWEGARKSGLKTGAYHFFSYDSSGQMQAENFIATVPMAAEALPPVVDVEFYGAYGRKPADKMRVLPELDTLLTRLEAHYGQKPILYATGRAYRLYLKGEFPDNPVWIRDVYKRPRIPDGGWMFWQYTDRGKLEGYDGEEEWIDLNVFNGDEAAFEALYRK